MFFSIIPRRAIKQRAEEKNDGRRLQILTDTGVTSKWPQYHRINARNETRFFGRAERQETRCVVVDVGPATWLELANRRYRAKSPSAPLKLGENPQLARRPLTATIQTISIRRSRPSLLSGDAHVKTPELPTPESGRRLKSFVPISGYSLSRQVRRRQNLPHKAAYRLSFYLRPGGIVEWLVAKEGAGAVTLALQLLSQSSAGGGAWAVVDTARECYVPALSGWGIDPKKILVIRPATLQETCWSIEQCLRCPGVSATWAWVDQRIPARVHRRWQMAAETGGGVGMFFRPAQARREPIWADLRLMVTPGPGGQGETRRLHIETLYRRGGLGGTPRRGRSTMPRVLCVWFPRWPIQRLRNARPELRRSEAVLFAGQNQRPVIIACTAKAERRACASANRWPRPRHCCPKQSFFPLMSPRTEPLVSLQSNFSASPPWWAWKKPLSPSALLCEVAGCTHLWDGEEGFVQAVLSYWRGRGYHIHLALAGTLGAAWALAHTKVLSLVPEGAEEEAISGLPVASLRLPADTLERLVALGLYTIGEVVKLPRDTLVSRFGVILPRRIDQVLGLLPETFICERLKEPLTACREWEVPIDDRFAVTYLCRQLLRELLAKAGRVGMGLLELEGKIQTEADSITIEIRLVEPTCDESHLAQLIELQLERRAWSGGVIAVRWSAPRLGRLEQAQGRWFVDDVASKTSRGFNALVERLSSRLEATAVLRVELVADAQPEHAVQLVPWTGPPPPKTDKFHWAPNSLAAVLSDY